MEHNASHLLVLFGGFVAVMTLPIWIGLVAILRDKGD